MVVVVSGFPIRTWWSGWCLISCWSSVSVPCCCLELTTQSLLSRELSLTHRLSTTPTTTTIC